MTGSLSPLDAEVRAGRAALVKIRDETSKHKSESLEVARKLASELAKGNVDLLAKYKEHKPRNDQLEERKAALMFFQQAVADVWVHLKTEHVDLVRLVLTEERDNLQRNLSERDQETQAQIKELDEELAALPSGSMAYAPATQAPEQKPAAPKSKA